MYVYIYNLAEIFLIFYRGRVDVESTCSLCVKTRLGGSCIYIYIYVCVCVCVHFIYRLSFLICLLCLTKFRF